MAAFRHGRMMRRQNHVLWAIPKEARLLFLPASTGTFGQETRKGEQICSLRGYNLGTPVPTS